MYFSLTCIILFYLLTCQADLPLNMKIMRSTSKPASPSYSLPRFIPYKLWDKENMEMAVAILEKGEVSIRRAAKIYNIPRSTLHDRVSGRINIDSKPGKKPYLTIEEEKELVSFFLKFAKIGYSRTPKEALAIVQHILENKGVHHVGDVMAGGSTFATDILN